MKKRVKIGSNVIYILAITPYVALVARMKQDRGVFMDRNKNSWAFTIGLTLLLALSATAVRADKIVTRNGQTLEGVIKDENKYNVRLDNRGNIISVPVERIKKIDRLNLDENVQMLLDRATEALGRSDMTGARSYVEQARTLNTTSPAVVAAIDKMNKQIQEMTYRGGTPEERRMRAEALLARAKEAYDLIKRDEGNSLVLEALKADPTNANAHEMINSLLTTKGADGKRTIKENADLLLAADYFTKVIWPNNTQSIKMDSPVIILLPRIYATLAQLFSESSDPERSKGYAVLMKTLADAFAQHPTWKETKDEKIKAYFEQPVEVLLAGMIKDNVDKKNYELALKKLEGMMGSDSSVSTCLLYLRSLVGAGQFPEAIALLDKVIATYPNEPTLPPQRRALAMLVQAQQQEKIDKKTALTNYESIFGTRENLIPEIGNMVGHMLAQMKGPDMDPAMAAGQVARAADVAAIVMQYSDDPALRRHAAQVLVSNLQKIPWKLDLVWKFNGTAVPLPEEAVTVSQEVLKGPLVVQFDQNSPFVVRLTVNATTAAPTAAIVQALSTGQAPKPPAAITAFQFTLEAMHPTLGTIYKNVWKSSDVPKAAVLFVPPPPPGAAPKATPTPADGAAPPSPTPTPKAPKVAAVDSGALLVLDSIDTFKVFMVLGLPNYVKEWPKVTLLPSHISVPKAQEILREQ